MRPTIKQVIKLVVAIKLTSRGRFQFPAGLVRFAQNSTII